MRVYLTGFMGAGKTAVGGMVAEILGCPLLDLDQEIEKRAGRSVREIFELDGESHFRDLEHACLKETARLDEAVVATGGGTMTYERNREVVRGLGTSVWLHPSFATILRRIDEGGRRARPLFRDPEEAKRLYEERLPAYRLADLEISIAPEETAAQVAERLAARLRERRCGT